MTIRTRFAPSPTGMMQLGNVRTALFNFLFARHTGGEFLIRIEDTDKARNTKEAVQVIHDALDWLDLKPDAAPVYQSARAARHAEIARELLANGQAYYCYCTPDELREMREAAQAAGLPPRYNGYWRDRDPATAPAIDPVIRLKVPQAGETVIEDLVQGTVRVANSELDDMIILRSDGTPTYLHAVVVDDHDMAISHVIRGDDHLTNTFRQAQIYRAMGWDLPHFAHIPLIHGADGAKLSKRHGAVSVLEFRQAGILPEALCNYLLRLGWGHGDAEILTREEQIKLFTLEGVGRAASRMDYAKLNHLNGVWLRAADDARLTADVIARLPAQCGVTANAVAEARILMLMPGLKERAKTLVELTASAAFLARQIPLPFEAKAEALLTAQAREMLARLIPILIASDFSTAGIDASLRSFAEAETLKLGQVAQPLRAALTGCAASPGIDATIAALGREETIARLQAVAK
jgi:glutamyl-tRNA synthetase